MNIFATSPSKDYLDVYKAPNRVQEYLGFKNEDVAKAAGAKTNTIRYDRLSKDVEKRILEWATLLNLVAEHFNGDIERTITWFNTDNPMLGNVAPSEMIKFGRFAKLQQIIIDCLEEYSK